jgi:hypothetical protein
VIENSNIQIFVPKKASIQMNYERVNANKEYATTKCEVKRE